MNYMYRKKHNKRQSKLVSLSSTQNFMTFIKEYVAVIALIIPILPSVIFAGIFAKQYGYCYFFQISLQSYLGLSNANIVVQSILLFSIGVGLLSLNVLGYIATLKNSGFSILLLIVSPFLLSLFTALIASISDFKILFNAILPFFTVLFFIGLFPGICFAFPDKKSIKDGQKYLLYDKWESNKVFKYILLFLPILIIAFSILFSVGYSSCFKLDRLYFTEVNGKEYAILYESNDYYQLATTVVEGNNPQRKIIINQQMRINKDNLLVYPKATDLSDLFVNN
ncbi:MAG: hypothetical protein ACK5MV_04250 [Aminipila sp.]